MSTTSSIISQMLPYLVTFHTQHFMDASAQDYKGDSEHHPCLTDVKTEAQSPATICLKSHSWSVAKQSFKLSVCPEPAG